jgi:hypothetical protein
MNICKVPLPGLNLFCQLPLGHTGDHKVTVDDKINPVRSARVEAATAVATFPKFDRSNMFLYDPERPKEDPNDLLNRVHGGQMLDPHAMNHNCPFCSKTMAWDLFVAHAEACFRRWRKVAYRARRILTSG